MLRKKEIYTVVTPIPGFIPRRLAVDILHAHSEVITLNPLVIDHKPIPAPRDAAADEFYSTWYEITERVQFVPGAGKLGSSKITFRGCFHNMPWGLQTHTYVPFGIDLRNRYRIAGNQPGVEAPEHRELGLEALGAPKDGLYLREDIEIRGNISVVGFVKSQLKAASKEMVQRIIRKAELLDAGVLHAMIQDGQLKTINPNDRSRPFDGNYSPMGSPSAPPAGFGQTSPGLQHRSSTLSTTHPYPQPPPASPGMYEYHQQFSHSQMSPPPIPPKEQQQQHPATPMELPGDFSYSKHHPQSSPELPAEHAAPHHYPPQGTLGASASGRLSGQGMPSPGYAPQGGSAELPTHDGAGQYGRS